MSVDLGNVPVTSTPGGTAYTLASLGTGSGALGRLVSLANWLKDSSGTLYVGSNTSATDTDVRVYGYNSTKGENQYVSLRSEENGTDFNTGVLEAVNCNLRLAATGGGHAGVHLGTSPDWSEWVVKNNDGVLTQIRGLAFDFSTNPGDTMTMKKLDASGTLSVENGPLILTGSNAEVRLDSATGDTYLSIYNGGVHTGSIQMQDGVSGGTYRFKNYMSASGRYLFHSSDDTEVFVVDSDGAVAKSYTVSGTGVQIVFGATASAPADTLTPDAWVWAKVGATDYRLPLYLP